MQKRRISFEEFDIPEIKGYEKIIDKDENTLYLFLKSPKNKYTLYFDSGMPIYDKSILNGCKEGGAMEFILADRKILLYCPTKLGDDEGLCFFNVEFMSDKEEALILPGQIIFNSGQVFQNVVDKKYSFINLLERIKLKIKDL